MRTPLVVLCIAILVAACAQSPFAHTPAVQNWMKGLEAHRPSLDELTEELKRLATGPKAQKKVPFSVSCPAALESALVVALTETHFKDGDNENFT